MVQPVDVRHPARPDLFDQAVPNAPMLFAVLDGDLPGRGVAEVGVVTPEAHRGHGYAPIAVALLAAGLADRGLAMYWSCDADNSGSVRVAGKLVFGEPHAFRLLLYRPLAG